MTENPQIVAQVRQHVVHLTPLAQVAGQVMRLDPNPLSIIFLERIHQVLDLDHGCRSSH